MNIFSPGNLKEVLNESKTGADLIKIIYVVFVSCVSSLKSFYSCTLKRSSLPESVFEFTLKYF
jgi:hypothetical protein